MEHTLVLNVTFEPLKVVDWQRAMVLWCQGKVEILETHDREIRAVSFTFKMPSIVRFLRMVRVKRSGIVPFTRANIYRRDDFTCQYCEQVFATEDLSFDHVHPEALGGKRTWENIVTCCVPCNRRKGHRTLAEAGLTLRKKPVKPAPSPVFRVTLGLKQTPDSWRDYLYWNVTLE